MNANDARLLATQAVLAIAEIKAAIEAFDRGQANVWDALTTITEACDACARHDTPRRDAA